MNRKEWVAVAALVAAFATVSVAVEASNGLGTSAASFSKVVDPATGCHYLVVAKHWGDGGIAVYPRMMANGRQFCQRSVPIQ